MMDFALLSGRTMVLLTAALTILTATGCSRFKPEDPTLVAPTNPKQAAAQVSEAFEQAAPEVKEMAAVAAESMRQIDYENAVISLGAIIERQGVTRR